MKNREKSTKEKESQDYSKECEERLERRERTRTMKGALMDLDFLKRKIKRAANDLNKRVHDAYELMRLPHDVVKLTATIDGLDFEMNRFRNLRDQQLDLLMTLGDDEDKSDEEKFNDLWECIADLKTKLKDLEIERAETVSHRSSRSSSSRTSNPPSTSKQALIEAATLKEKMKSLQRRQEFDRQQEELQRRQRELQRLEEQEQLRGALDAAETIKGILCDEKSKSLAEVTKELQDPWDIEQLEQFSKHDTPLSLFGRPLQSSRGREGLQSHSIEEKRVKIFNGKRFLIA